MLHCRIARKIKTVRHQPPTHQLKENRESDEEVFSVNSHVTYLVKMVHYFEKSQNKKVNTKNKPREVWQGAFLDTGAQKTVIGERQARAYCKFVGCKFKLQSSRTVFRFGVDRQKSRGRLAVRVPVPDGSMMLLNVDVVGVDVLLLFGLDILDKFKLNVNTVDNPMDSKLAGWSIPLVRKLGHIYLQWQKEDKVLYTESELLNFIGVFIIQLQRGCTPY